MGEGKIPAVRKNAPNTGESTKSALIRREPKQTPSSSTNRMTGSNDDDKCGADLLTLYG
jgi:hypothetical protein